MRLDAALYAVYESTNSGATRPIIAKSMPVGLLTASVATEAAA